MDLVDSIQSELPRNQVRACESGAVRNKTSHNHTDESLLVPRVRLGSRSGWVGVRRVQRPSFKVGKSWKCDAKYGDDHAIPNT